MKKISVFRRYWEDLSKKIRVLVETRGARVYMPSEPRVEEVGDRLYKISFSSPAFFYNAPQKASSRRNGLSHRQAIFVDGDFVVRQHDDSSSVSLEGASCSLSIYQSEEVEGPSYKLTLVDAMHFDVEGDPQSDFHPFFHVQRGHSRTVTHEQIKALVKEHVHVAEDNVLISDDVELGSPYVRLPTPQMDYLNVLTTVVADFFCRASDGATLVGGRNRSSTKELFRELLHFVMGNRNLLADSELRRRLRKRWNNPDTFCAGHWYSESI